MGLQTVLAFLCCFQSSVRPSEVADSIGSHGQRVSDQGGHTEDEDEAEVDPTSQVIHQGGPLPPSNGSSKQEPGEQTATLSSPDPGMPQHDNLQAPGQAPVGGNTYFPNAQNVILNQPVMIDINGTEEKVLKWLDKFTMSGAEFDAGGHVPGCHPGTRITILETLVRWVRDTQHVCRMVWLYGTAGVGKSAILQSLAERLSEASRLGATFFFSRPNERDKPTFVLPTIAYQLAVRVPHYKEYVKQIMINDPKLPEKDMERQFQAFIIQPFTTLGLTAEGGRWVILLDGLDECQGEDAQIHFVNLISRFTSEHPTAPLVWVIASRPEAHLQAAFNSEEVRGSFNEHEVLANSDHACRDVEKYLRAKFAKIRQRYNELMPIGAPWPTEQDITRVSMTSLGLFILAATIVDYVNDPDTGDPISQLTTVLSVTQGLEPGSLSTLYALYSKILTGVPKTQLPTLKLVLAFYTTTGMLSSGVTNRDTEADEYPLVLFATIFGLQQNTVYGSLRKLHSVIKVPPPSESGRLAIKFYHASFTDYLETLEVYAIDADMMMKFWRGWSAIVHGGDLTAYRDATSDGRPPVPLSWDVQLADRVLGGLWLTGVQFLLHLPLPRCRRDDHSDKHLHLSLNAKELQNFLEKIDFSAPLFIDSNNQWTVVSSLFDLFTWLFSAGPPELLRSEVVKKMPMRELNFACIPEAKTSYEGTWDRDADGEPSRYGGFNCFTGTIPPPYLLRHWKDKDAVPVKKLTSKLDELRRKDPMMDVLIVGGQPSKRCAFIWTQPTAEEGLFYYMPYCQ